ncbi:uncharacterized protein LOC130989645 [Salvia miltiorrhiza]|uniref:uncharacterized protein LOC130989645 n=1 Tax=Salvia miltiorrhiza TaxID=226208 RepID=UPI0025AD0843|nr:uncharacterized protein LOC130989645 [Salvia miltiorrhiza]
MVSALTFPLLFSGKIYIQPTHFHHPHSLSPSKLLHLLLSTMDDELQDWEVLHHNSDSESVPLDEIDSTGFIHTDYFSLDSLKRYGQDLDDGKSAVSENPSWIDPALEDNPARYLNKESTDFWSDSSSDRSEDRHKFTDFLLRNQMNFYKGIREVVDEKGDKVDSTRTEETKSSEDIANVSGKVQEAEIDKMASGNEHLRDDGIDKKSHVVWWKMPMEFVKYFVFRMSPVWTISVAAAFMGFVILGRRLYKMKKKKNTNKARGLQIRVAVDDKKVSQVMSHAPRLNEAFSVVKRVPAIRPSLPVIGVTTWPAMTIR